MTCGDGVLPDCPLPAGHAGVHEECPHDETDVHEGVPHDRAGRCHVWRVCVRCGASVAAGTGRVI